MLKAYKRIISLVLCMLMLVSAFSAVTLADTEQEDAGFDYIGVLDNSNTYIINPAWSSLSSGQQVSYYYRGQRIETYDPARHFSSFDAAYEHWMQGFESSAAGSVNGYDPDIALDTPTFIFAAGDYTGVTDITVRFNANLLGANAGINPNAVPDEIDPTAGLELNSVRTQESVLYTNITRTTRVGGSNTNLTYEQIMQAAGVDTLNLRVDGFKFASGSLLKAEDVDVNSSLGVTGNRNFYAVYENIIYPNSSVVAFNCQDTTKNHNHITFKNSRLENYGASSLFNKYFDSITLDGIYYTGGSGSLMSGERPAFIAGRQIEISVKNCYFYKTNASYLFSPKFTNAAADIHMSFEGNIFYESVSSSYGVIVFYTLTEGSTYVLDFIGNTVIADRSFNDQDKTTVFNGNPSYQLYPYTFNVNYNRFIGYTSMFPNLTGIDNSVLEACDFDFNDNYFAPEYNSSDDVLGTRSEYSTTTPPEFKSPIDLASLRYYIDYGLNAHIGDVDIIGTSFYEQADSISIDSDNHTVLVFFSEGVIEQPSLIFRKDNMQVFLYSDMQLENKINSIDSDDLLNGDLVCYSKAEVGPLSVTYTITFVHDQIADFSTGYTDPQGVISNSAYIIDEQAAQYAYGEKFVSTWQGQYYRFTAGVNAFASLDEIPAGGTPQVLLPAGSYGDIEVDQSISIYGENYSISPAYKTGGLPDSGFGIYSAFTGERRSEVGDIIINDVNASLQLEIYGVNITGSVIDSLEGRSHSLRIENSLMDYKKDADITTLLDVNSASLSSLVLKNVAVKNLYLDILPSALPQVVELDGLYIDGVPQGGLFDIGWQGQAGSFSLKNSNIRGYTLLQGQALITTGSGAQGGSITVENNIFASAYSCAGSIFKLSPLKGSAQVSGNCIVNTSGNLARLAVLDYSTGQGVYETVFNDNRAVGFDNEIETAQPQNILVFASFKDNYIAPFTSDYLTAEQGLDVVGRVVSTGYYADFAMTDKRQPLTLTGIDFAQSLEYYSIDTDYATLEMVLAEGRIDNPGFILSSPTATAQLYEDTAFAKPVNSLVYDQLPKGKLTYYLLITDGSAQKYYTVTVITGGEYEFASSYTDPLNEISADALLVDANASTAVSGADYYTRWEGELYKFVAGQNVFASISDALAAAQDSAQILLAPGSYSAVEIEPGIEIYGPDRGVDPSLRGINAEDDWARNPLWGRYGEAVVLNVVISGESSLPVKVKGITLAGRFYDALRTTPGTLTVENILVKQQGEVEFLDGSVYELGNFETYVFLLGNPAAVTGLNADGSSSQQNALLKNIRFEGVYNSSLTSDNSHRILAEYLPAHTTVEGFYVSSKYITSAMFGYTKCGTDNSDTSLVIKDSYFSGVGAGGQYFKLEGRNKQALESGQTSSVSFDNNVFIDVSSNTALIYFVPCSYSEMSITDNIVVNTKSSQELFGAKYIEADSEDYSDAYTITGNRFVGVENNWHVSDIDDGMQTATVLDMTGNFISSYTAGYRYSEAGVAPAGDVEYDYYYLDYGLTMRSNELQSYSFGGAGAVADAGQKILTININSLDARASYTLNLNNYILSNKHNVIKVAGQADISNIAVSSVNDKFDISVYSPDGVSKSEAWELNFEALADTVDYSGLQKQLDEAEKYLAAASGSYITVTIEALRDAVEYGSGLINNEKEQAVVNKAAQDIIAAINALIDVRTLNNTIASAGSLVQQNYSQASWAALAGPLAAAESAAQTATTDIEVSNANATLEQAIDSLVDITELNARIAEAAEMDLSSYSQASIDLLDAAVESAEAAALEAVAESDVTEAIENLEQAIDSLVDISALKQAIAEAKAAQEAADDYTVASIAAISEPLAAAEKAALEATTAEEVTEAITALEAAVDGLVYVKDLKAAIAEAELIDTSDYSEASAAEFEAKLTAVKAALEATSQSAVDTALSELEAAIEGLSADWTELEAAIAAAKAKQGEKGYEYYTEGTKTEVANALAAAEGLADNAGQKAVDAAAAALNEAVSGLVADTGRFESEVAAYEAISNADGKYTEESYEALQAAIAAAKAIENPTVAQMADAIAALEAVELVEADTSLISIEGAVEDGNKLKVDVDKATSYKLAIELVKAEKVEVFADPDCKVAIAADAELTLSQKTTRVYVKAYTEGDKYELITIEIETEIESVEYADKIPAWANTYVEYLNEGGYGLLIGDENGNFNPGKEMTRYEIAVVAAKLMGVDASKFAGVKLEFGDNIANWASNYVKAVVTLGIMSGNDNGGKITFDGQNPTQRQQFARIMAEAIRILENTDKDPVELYNEKKAEIDKEYEAKGFADESSVQSWAKPYVRLAVVEYELLSGSPADGKLYINGNSNILRQEISVVLAKYLGCTD